MYVLFYFFLILLFNIQCYAFNQESVYFVDKIGNNWLFRGDFPISGNSFNYNALRSALRNETTRLHINMPEKIFFVDINMLFIEKNIIAPEVVFFNENPDFGMFVHWPIFNLLTPSSVRVFDKKVDNAIPNNGQLFGLMYNYENYYPQHVKMLIDIMHQNYGDNRVFYVHCGNGCDRVSEIIGAYRMHKQKMSLRESYVRTSSECSGMHYFSKLALEWYCYYIKDSENNNERVCVLE